MEHVAERSGNALVLEDGDNMYAPAPLNTSAVTLRTAADDVVA